MNRNLRWKRFCSKCGRQIGWGEEFATISLKRHGPPLRPIKYTCQDCFVDAHGDKMIGDKDSRIRWGVKVRNG